MSPCKRIIICFLCLGISACSSSEAIRGRDSTLFPYLRTSTPLGDAESEKAALEIDISGGGGEDSQQLGAGEVVEVNRDSIAGPGKVDLDFDILAVTVQARFRFYEIGPFRAEFMAGAGFQRVKLQAELGSLRAHDNVGTIGPMAGGGLTYRALDWMDLQVRWRTIPLAFGEAIAGMSRFEAMGLFRVAPHVRVVAGWTRWRYIESLGDNEAQTSLRLSGFFGGLEFY